MNTSLTPLVEALRPGSPDIEIARAVAMRPIMSLAEERLGIPHHALIPFGHYKAKLSLDYLATLADRPQGKLVLVTAISPTPAGEGKTTTSVGLGDAFNRLGMRTTTCLREPSLGPCFGMKGGATGGGRAQVVPMEDINLHFNGDFHAVTSAHNLLAALLDNHLHWGNALDIDPHQIVWKRAIDINDRALRHITIGLGGAANGLPREDGFDITVASEIMAILCLARDLGDLENRLGRIIVAYSRDGSPVTAHDLGAAGAMAVLLKDALQPNLVQSLEHNPAFIHGGPFGNIAHGCSSVMATRAALALSDVVVTEAGFGADLGAEKFIDIKCRQSGLSPDAAVLVCTLRALRFHGGADKTSWGMPNPEAMRQGFGNLRRHVDNLQRFGLSPIVAINTFDSDSREEIDLLQSMCAELGIQAVETSHWAHGGAGAMELAKALSERLEAGGAPHVRCLYPDMLPLIDKIRTLATELYGAADIALHPAAARRLQDFEEMGYGDLPVCIAKTQYSFSCDPQARGAPEGHRLDVREVRLSAGAGFVVAVCGDIMTMPGLPRQPAAMRMGLDDQGHVVGLA
ncbi:formate--tetrahydrofolate ligase [Litchfieldella qijiaojingensis]|uniref:Formate--tetrahydrofolate ligase n=1 Tax=Litchfieldella qijiaojingensis TaxID=980347 RepID=A0ABQ2YXC9_9GAMM|nr:formate--tetrahydrofolate ligase [Halomonas qijiaojingensis]GGX98383.1 formate--tetrahydrofolate ligase [Halomonas qijiaojingensis]